MSRDSSQVSSPKQVQWFLPAEHYKNIEDEGNSKKYHTGKLCIEGCGRPAGTAWSPYWCFECNVKRMNRINEGFERLISKSG